MRISLISTGDEILFGEVQDTNTTYAANNLCDAGFEIYRHHTCGDSLDDLKNLMSQALEESDIVICCGGLGPTVDDRPAEAVAMVMGVDWTENEEALTQVKNKMASVLIILKDIGRQVLPIQSSP